MIAVRPLPKWAMQRYAKLWNEFDSREFNYEQASELLRENDAKLLSVLLSYLRKYGWLDIKLHPEDARKRIYQLKSPEEAIEGMVE